MLAEPQWLQNKLKVIPSQRLGRSSKTRANVLANAVAALTVAGLAKRRPVVERSADWQLLWERLPPSARIALGSFTRFCSYHGIIPARVTDQVVADFKEVMILSSLRKKPAEAIYDLTVTWNKAADQIQGWPEQKLSVPRRRVRIASALQTLPASLRRDLEDYFDWLERNDVLAEDAPPRLAKATIKHRRGQILRFIGDLLLSAVGPDELPNLRAVVHPVMAYRGLTAMLDRRGGTSGMIHGMAYTLLIIAKHYVKLPDEDQQKLRNACARLKVKRDGMTEKNRARLRPFNDPHKLSQLLLLPDAIMEEAKSDALSPKAAAARAETALAIQLLLMTLLRIKNLASLHIDENLHWTRLFKQGACHLVIDGRHVKNGEDPDYELAGPTAALLRTYIAYHRCHLAPNTCRWLFARRDGRGPVNSIVLSNRISRAIRKRTGLTVNAHLFRHLGAKTYLDQRPGGYEVVRRMLGHKHLSRTMSAYTCPAARNMDPDRRPILTPLSREPISC
jgi:integrase